MKDCIIFLVIISLLFSCEQSQNNSNNDFDTTAQIIELEKPEKKGIEVGIWRYSKHEYKNEMGDKVTSYSATTTSLNKLNSDYPPDNRLSLTLKNNDDDNSIELNVKYSIFSNNYKNDKKIKARFDENPATYYAYSTPGGGKSGRVLIEENDVERFIEALKKAKKLEIEIECFKEGIQVSEFDVSNLKWDR